MAADDRKPTVWLDPLFVNHGGANIEVGVMCGTFPTWWVRVGERIVAPESDWRPLLPLMQPGFGGGYPTAYEMVVERLVAAGQNPDFVDSFPFEVPVLGADLARAVGWQRLAEPWRPHVRKRYAWAVLRGQLRRLREDRQDTMWLPPTSREQNSVMREFWCGFDANTEFPAWSSGWVDAAVRWSAGDGVRGIRRLWRALFILLRLVEPNILHWNLVSQLWLSTLKTGFHNEMMQRPPKEVHAQLSASQALLVLRFVDPRGALADRVRRRLGDIRLATEIRGRRFHSVMPLDAILS